MVMKSQERDELLGRSEGAARQERIQRMRLKLTVDLKCSISNSMSLARMV